MGLTAEEALGAARKYVRDSLAGAGALKGDTGESAYEIAVRLGFEGTEQEWLQSLKVVETVVYVSSTPQASDYNINLAIREAIEQTIANPDVKNGALISIMQPFHDGTVTLMGSGYILDHGDEVWSGSVVFSVPTAITSINMVGTYDFQYIRSTNQLAIERTIHNDDLTTYAVAKKQDPKNAGLGLMIDDDGNVIPGTVQAEVGISKTDDNVITKKSDGLYVGGEKLQGQLNVYKASTLDPEYISSQEDIPYESPVPRDADTLGGHAPDYFVSAEEFANLLKVQSIGVKRADSGGNIDLGISSPSIVLSAYTSNAYILVPWLSEDTWKLHCFSSEGFSVAFATISNIYVVVL